MKGYMYKLLIVSIVSLIVVSTSQTTSADTMSFQQGIAGYTGVDDNQLLDPGTGFQDANVGGRNTTQLGNASSITTRRVILRFNDLDVLDIPGLVVLSAQITLKKANGPTGGGTDSAEMYAISDSNADWVEGTSQFVVTPGESSWNSKFHPTPWIGGGGGGTLGPLQDTIPNVSGNDPANTVYTFNLDPALVQQWITGVNAGVVIKEGLEIDGAGSGTDLQIEFYSAEFGGSGDAVVRPKLDIEYIPEPATLSLLVIGGFAMLRRRRFDGAHHRRK